MAQEAVLVLRTESPIDFTVADGTAVAKGSLMKLTTPRTAIITSGANDQIAGIAARDKIASDGRTQLACFREGIFRMYASGAITAGFPVCSAGVVNMVKYIATPVSGAQVIGYALADIADKAAGEIYVQVGMA